MGPLDDTGMALIAGAVSFAARKHRHQLRADRDTPYVAHVCRVAMTASLRFGLGDPEALAAAVLHDVIEDTRTDYDDLEERFGAGVADFVVALTDNKSLPEVQRDADHHRRIGGADWRVRVVKLADVFDNLLDRRAGERTARQVARSVANARAILALARPDTPLHPESARAVAAVEGVLAAMVRDSGEVAG